MNILITGGTGYLAGRLYKHFKKKKYNVKIATRKSKKISKEFSNEDIVRIDWKNINDLIPNNFKNGSKYKKTGFAV